MICPTCKVKLNDDLNKCPLCGKLISINNKQSGLYSSDIEYYQSSFDILYFTRIIAIMLIISSIITIICNFAINHTLTWSLIVVCSSFYLITHRLYFTSLNRILVFIINTIALELLLLSIVYIANGYNWYLCLVMPFVLMVAIYVIICYCLFNRENILRCISYKLFYIAICLIVINGLIKMFLYNCFYITWSIYAVIPLLVLSIIIFILSFNNRIVSEIKKRTFI